ncbi:MAG: DivIVA domain-containing protein [Halanaerobium sp.]|nr:DivIVA domain-containing protein [Halanaerobium sp.]
MRLSPIDIYQKEFKKKLQVRGYDPDEVDQFVERVAQEYEMLFKELNHLQEENQEIKKELENYRSLENRLNNTLVVAQETLEDKRAQAEKEAERIVKEARVKAREVFAKASEQIEGKRRQYEKLCQMEELFRIRLKNLLKSQLEYLDKDHFAELNREMEKTIRMEKQKDDLLEKKGKAGLEMSERSDFEKDEEEAREEGA